MKKIFSVMLLVCAFSLILFSCQSKETTDGAQAGTEQTTVKGDTTVAKGKPAAEKALYSWQKPHAKVLPDGNLEWAPEPFVFEKGDSVRYIDFESGNDSNEGTSKTSPWKHHPWDGNAAAKAKACKGIHTYVFKGGVTYKGALNGNESGKEGNPIRLTRDPSWGEGYPVFSGSKTIKGGWKKASASEVPGIPEPDKVWYRESKDFDKDPYLSNYSCIWQVEGDKVERLHVARTPNYEFSDPNNPLKNWYKFQKIDHKKNTFYSSAIMKLKGTSASELKDVVVWATAPTLMGSAYPRSMRGSTFNIERGSVKTKAFGKAYDYFRHKNWNYHMIENAAVLLDAPGEYFYARQGKFAGRLYLRPPGDIDPNTVTYEVADIINFITFTNQNNIVISGLEFRYNDPDNNQRKDNTRHNTKAAHCILAIGGCQNITVKNNKFNYVVDAVEFRLRRVREGGSEGQVMHNIFINDNEVYNASGAGVISILGPDTHPIHPKTTKWGKIKHVEVMRNRTDNTGFRGANARWDSLPAIAVMYPETCHIAGNIITNSFGIGLITNGGKASGFKDRTVPLVRYLIHHNRIENSMFNCNDYGGLEHFQGGPTYHYNNVSRNTVGNRSFWNHQLGYNYYLDGGFKCYAFNNILAGDIRKDDPEYFSHCGYFMVFGFLNQFFNNTIYRFQYGVNGSSGNRSNVVGNLITECRDGFLVQNRPGDHSMLGGGDTGEMGRQGIPTMAYDSNVFYGSPKEFGQIAGTKKAGEKKGKVVSGKTLEELSKVLADNKCRLSGVGVQVDKQPMADPVKFDYRPAADAGTKDHGVKYFVPWALARMVGEWNFYKSASTPNVVLGENFYMTDEYHGRSMYYHIPRMDLNVSEATPESYVDGPLEDWIEGALSFDGKRVAVLPHKELVKDMTYGATGKHQKSGTAYDGSKRETVDMNDNNFLIEIYFKADSAGSLVAKTDGTAGYELKIGSDGKAVLVVLSGGNKAEVSSSGKLNDGKWYHLIVEADRKAGTVQFYVDGTKAGDGKLNGIGNDASLTNSSDFVVGKDFSGAVDFLRVCRATLAEALTDIDELYTWQFDGPQFKDFTGADRGDTYDAGAIEVK